MLSWCIDCKNADVRNGYIGSKCLVCRWGYVGQEAFDHKPDLFEGKNDSPTTTPRNFFGDSIEFIGCEVI